LLCSDCFAMSYLSVLALILLIVSYVSAAAEDCPQHFDAGSFFGGIILALGLLGVGYGVYRYWSMRHRRIV